MRRWECVYLLDGANGHKTMTIASIDMRQAISVFGRELEREHQDVRSLTYLRIEEVA